MRRYVNLIALVALVTVATGCSLLREKHVVPEPIEDPDMEAVVLLEQDFTGTDPLGSEWTLNGWELRDGALRPSGEDRSWAYVTLPTVEWSTGNGPDEMIIEVKARPAANSIYFGFQVSGNDDKAYATFIHKDSGESKYELQAQQGTPGLVTLATAPGDVGEDPDEWTQFTLHLTRKGDVRIQREDETVLTHTIEGGITGPFTQLGLFNRHAGRPWAFASLKVTWVRPES